MKLVKSFFIAFSMYSKIPVPQFEWEEKNMSYVLCFFPWVGAVIGLCMIGWTWLCREFQIGIAAHLLVSAAIPILITGGIHIDGFMDTMDALHSYGDKEKKLEILKDSHIGAFSMIMLLLYSLIYLAAISELQDKNTWLIFGIGFVLSRVLSAIAALTFRPAKNTGMLRTFTGSANKRNGLVFLLFQLFLCMAGMMRISYQTAFFVLAGCAGCFAYYRFVSYKEFGGVTGDTAGYFVCICEAVIAIAAALAVHLRR